MENNSRKDFDLKFQIKKQNFEVGLFTYSTQSRSNWIYKHFHCPFSLCSSSLRDSNGLGTNCLSLAVCIHLPEALIQYWVILSLEPEAWSLAQKTQGAKQGTSCTLHSISRCVVRLDSLPVRSQIGFSSGCSRDQPVLLLAWSFPQANKLTKVLLTEAIRLSLWSQTLSNRSQWASPTRLLIGIDLIYTYVTRCHFAFRWCGFALGAVHKRERRSHKETQFIFMWLK